MDRCEGEEGRLPGWLLVPLQEEISQAQSWEQCRCSWAVGSQRKRISEAGACSVLLVFHLSLDFPALLKSLLA